MKPLKKDDLPRPISALLTVTNGKMWFGLVFLILIIALGVYRSLDKSPTDEGNDGYLPITSSDSDNQKNQFESELKQSSGIRLDPSQKAASGSVATIEKSNHVNDPQTSKDAALKAAVDRYNRDSGGLKGDIPLPFSNGK